MFCSFLLCVLFWVAVRGGDGRRRDEGLAVSEVRVVCHEPLVHGRALHNSPPSLELAIRANTAGLLEDHGVGETVGRFDVCSDAAFDFIERVRSRQWAPRRRTSEQAWVPVARFLLVVHSRGLLCRAPLDCS